MLRLSKMSLTSGKKSSFGNSSSDDVVVASSRARALLKNLIAPHPYRFTRGGVPEAYCPDLRCTPQDGMGKTKAAAQGSGGRRVCGLIYRLGLAQTLI